MFALDHLSFMGETWWGVSRADLDVPSCRQVRRFCRMEVGCRLLIWDPGRSKGDTKEVGDAQSMRGPMAESWGDRGGDEAWSEARE